MINPADTADSPAHFSVWEIEYKVLRAVFLFVAAAVAIWCSSPFEVAVYTGICVIAAVVITGVFVPHAPSVAHYCDGGLPC